MSKIVKSSKIISPFGGISLVFQEFNNLNLPQLIDNHLGSRGLKGVSNSCLFQNWLGIFFCGGKVAEDIQYHLADTLSQEPNFKKVSSTTLLRGLNDLSVDNKIINSSTNNNYDFNINNSMNDLNIKLLLKTKQLLPQHYYDLDYDNQIIEHNKYDAKRTYKKTKGYCPAIATIGDKVVYIENRDGNANVKVDQHNTLTRTYKLLDHNNIKINRSRMDAGSYSKDIIEVVANNSKQFYIRANRSQNVAEQIKSIEQWEDIELNYKQYQVASLKFTQFFEDKNYRLVIMREKSNTQQIDAFTGDNFSYRSILTNDHKSTELEVIQYYNQRGASEKIFDVMNNDFGWSRLPCSDMHKNTVFLILTAMIKNFYNHMVAKVSKVFKDIKTTSRLKRFIFSFISVSSKWIKNSRQHKLILYTNKDYDRLNII